MQFNNPTSTKMKPKKMTTLHFGKSSGRSPLRLGFLLIPLTLVCLALSPTARAVTPAPDGCPPNFTTAKGCDALYDLTTGVGNTALDWRELSENTYASSRTG